MGSIIGFDIQIPEDQPNEYYFGAVQLYMDLPSRGINNTFVGQKDLTYLPRGNFRRVEFPLSSALQTALRSTYTDLRLRFAINAPGGTGPYLLDRISFTHAESEPIDDSRNANILGFETSTSWIASAGTVAQSSNRTEKAFSMSVIPAGWTVITSARLATPSEANDRVGFDLRMPRVALDWVGETQLYVDLPSQGIFNAYVGRHELSEMRADAFNRVSYTLPPNVSSKLAEPFDDLRFKIVLNTPTGTGPYVLDRFRFGPVKEPTETVEPILAVPRNIGPNDLLLVATEALTLGPGVRIEAGASPLGAVASLGSGGVSLGADTEVDSIVSYGPVGIGASARVRGYIGGADPLSVDQGALIWGEVIGERAPLESATFRTSFGPTTSDVFVDAETSTALAPGRYRDVEVTGGVLLLAPGSYAIDRLTVGTAGSIEYDSRDGSPFVAIRTALHLGGATLDRAIGAGVAPLGAPTWAYMGQDSLEFNGTPPGPLVAPSSNIRVTLPPETSGVPTLWGIAGRRVEILADPGGSLAVRPGPTSSPLPPLPPGVPRPVAVSISANGAHTRVAEATTQDEPLTVFKDNPFWHGSFDWRLENQSGTGGCAPWFNAGQWQGILTATLTLWRLRPELNPAQAWSASLLPGYYFGSIPGADPCNLNPDTWPQAFFTTRAFNLWHGATFRITPTVHHTSAITANPPESLFVKLSNDVLLVPIVAIHWDGEHLLDDVGAQFDFVPSMEYPPDITPPARPPLAPYPNPGTFDDPPDDLWAQCGIQFQVIRALHLGPPEGLDVLSCSNDGNSCPGSAEQCACNRDERMPDYARDDELSARIRSALGTQFDDIFGPAGLQPILVQFGDPTCVRLGKGPNLGACQYAGKAQVSTSILGDVFVNGLVQINGSLGPFAITAHELGHVLLPDLPGDGHSPDPEHLMHASSGGRLITPQQCADAREVAARLSASYFAYNRRRGLTDPLSLPPTGRASFPGAVPPGAVSPEISLVCCDVGDGHKLETLAGMCFPPRGSKANDCNVCCNANGNDFTRVDNDGCDSGDVVPAEQCLLTCCELGDREETIPVGQCEREGEPCVQVCCQIGDSEPQLSTRGECARQDGDEVEPTLCSEEPPR